MMRGGERERQCHARLNMQRQLIGPLTQVVKVLQILIAHLGHKMHHVHVSARESIARCLGLGVFREGKHTEFVLPQLQRRVDKMIRRMALEAFLHQRQVNRAPDDEVVPQDELFGIGARRRGHTAQHSEKASIETRVPVLHFVDGPPEFTTRDTRIARGQ